MRKYHFNIKAFIKRASLGFFIGLGVIIPGISGSTIAILFKLYQPLLDAISQLLKKPRKSLHFLFPIIVGSLIGLGIGFVALKYVLKFYFFQTISLFAGLMLGSFPTLLKEIKKTQKTKYHLLLLSIGLLIPLLFSFASIQKNLEPKSLDQPFFYLIMIGLLIAGTQLIPGLSATALLMMLGYFQPLMNALSFSYLRNNHQVLFIFGILLIGFLIGIILISKFLHFLFLKTEKKAYYLFIGLSFSSIVTMYYNIEMHNWLSKSFDPKEGFLGLLFLLLGTALGYLFYVLETSDLDRLK